MRALVCSELGPADRLSVEEVPDPEPGPGEVVIDVRAAGLNFPDTLIIEGKYQFRPDPPFTPGGEASGVVSAVGSEVRGFHVGDEVVAMAVSGAFAEKWAVEASAVMCPNADGTETARYPFSTVPSTERKSGANPSAKASTSSRRWA